MAMLLRLRRVLAALVVSAGFGLWGYAQAQQAIGGNADLEALPRTVNMAERSAQPARPGNTQSSGVNLATGSTWLLAQQLTSGPSAGALRWTPNATDVYANTQGATANGLLRVYGQTGNAALLSAAVANGQCQLNNCIAGWTYGDGSHRFATHDPLFLQRLSQVSGDPQFASFVTTNFWNRLQAGTYGANNDLDAAGWANYVLSARTTQGYPELVAWDLSKAAIAAHEAGQTTAAQAIMVAIQASINAADAGHRTFDVIGLAGGIWASNVTGINLNATSGTWNGAANTAALAAQLAAFQASGGGFIGSTSVSVDDANADSQSTAYAILALATTNRTAYLQALLGAASFEASLQQASGEILSYPGAAPDYQGTVESHGESLEALSEQIDGIDRWVSAVGGVDSGDCSIQASPCATITYALSQASAGNTVHVAAGQYTNAITVALDGIKLIGDDPNNKPQIKRIAGGNAQALLVVNNVKNVQVRNFEFDMDQTFVAEGIIANGFVDGLVVDGNHFINSRSNAAQNSDWHKRIAVSINDNNGNSQNVGLGSGANVSVTNNLIDGVANTAAGVFLRIGVDIDSGVGTISGNTIATAVHDIRVRFSTVTGASSGNATLIDGNTLNGRGLELDDPNGGVGPITISNNHLNAPPGLNDTTNYDADFSLMRLIGNANGLPVAISANTFAGYRGHNRGVLVENFPATTFAGNIFTPASGATDFASLVFSNKNINSVSPPSAPAAMSTNANGNTFNGSGIANAGRAIEFLNDNDAAGTAAFGTLSFGTALSPNTFDGNLRWYFHLDDYNCETVNAPTCVSPPLPSYAGAIGSNPATNTSVRPFTGNVSATNNLFAGSAPSAATSNALFARTYDQRANPLLGAVDYGLTQTEPVVYVDDGFAGSAYGDALAFAFGPDYGACSATMAFAGINAFATIADGMSHVAPAGTVCIAKGTYAEAVNITASNLQVIGDGNTSVDTVVTGGITVNAGGSGAQPLLVANLRSSDAAPNANGITVNAVSHVAFVDLALVANANSGINLSTDADHISLADSLIDGNQTGLRTSSTSHVADVTITNTTFSNNKLVGLLLFGGSTSTGSATHWSIDGSHFSGNNNDDSGVWGSGIWLWSYGASSLVDGFSITHSTFADNGSSVDRRQSGIYVVAGDGGQMRNVSICNNTFAETAAAGTQHYGIYVYDDYNYTAYEPIQVCANNVFNGLQASISGENQFNSIGSNPVVHVTGGAIAGTNHINTPVERTRDNALFPTIALAMNDAATQDADEIHAPAGLYHESVALTHMGMTLRGDGASTVIDGSALAGSGVTLPAGRTGSTLKDFAVRNFANIGTTEGACVYGASGNSNTTISGLAIDNCVGGRAGILMNGPVDAVTIDNNDVGNIGGTSVRGIVIWNGFKTHIAITNNQVHDIGGTCCAAIELQDGTASGVTVTGNTITNAPDSGMGFIQLTSGAGPNVIANNTLSNTGRFGITLTIPNGTGQESGDGSIVVRDNTVTRPAAPSSTDQRDVSGIAVIRRGYGATTGETDVTTGVVVKNNTVQGWVPVSGSPNDGFGIVVEGTNMHVYGNTISGNDVALQVQQGNDGYPGDSDQNATNDFFSRGNAPLTCVDIGSNTLTSNTLDQRLMPAGASMVGADVTNVNTGARYCSITAAVAAATAGDHIAVDAGVHAENAIVSKPVVITGAGQALTTVVPAAFDPLTTTYTGAVIRVRASNVEISDLTVDGINPNLAGHATDIAARAGIMTDISGGPYANFSVHDTTVKNIYLRGIYAPDSPGGQGVSNFNFSNNTVSNVQSDPSSIGIFSRYGTGIVDHNTVTNANDAISANWSRGTTFSNNTITDAGSGIHTDNSHGAGGSSNDLIENNVVSCGTVAGGYGVWTFATYADVTVQGNSISACEIGLGAFSGRTDDNTPVATTHFLHNAADGTGAVLSAPGDQSIGAWLSTTSFYYGEHDNRAELIGNSITGFGIGVQTQRASGKSLTTTANVNRITGNGVGWADSGDTATATNGASEFTNNWWGCNGGPTVVGDGCDSATAVGNSDPWLVLSLPASPINIARDAVIAISADFNHNSAGGTVDTTALFPDGTSVAFSADNGASVTSPQSTTGGVATTSFSGLHLGQSTVTAAYENAHPTVLVQITPAMIVLNDDDGTVDGTIHRTYAPSTPQVVAATTTPSGLGYAVTYNGNPTAPTNAGTYTVVATVTDNCCQGSATGTLVIARAPTMAVFSPTSVVYDGNTHAISATLADEPATTCPVTGSPVGPNAGTYPVQTAICDGTNYSAPASNASIQITQASVTFALSHLTQPYDGAPKSVLVASTPTGVAYSVSYVGNGSTSYGPSSVPPTQIGSYTATVTSADPNYTGSNSATLQVVPSNGDISLVVNGPVDPIHVGDYAQFAATMLANPALHQGEKFAYELLLSKSGGDPLAVSDIASMEVFYNGSWIDVATFTGGSLPLMPDGNGNLAYTFPDYIPGYSGGFPILDPSWTWNVRFTFATTGTYTGSWTLEDGATHAVINPLVSGSAAVVVQPALPPTDIHLSLGGPAENVQANTPAEYTGTMLADPSLHTGETYFVKVTVAKSGGTHALAAADLAAVEIFYNGAWQALPAGTFQPDGNGNLVYFFPADQLPGGFAIQDPEWTWNFRITYADTGIYTATAEVIHASDAGQASPQVFASDAISTTVIAQVIPPPTMSLVLLGPVQNVLTHTPVEYTGTLVANPAQVTGRTFYVRIRLSKNGGTAQMTPADLQNIELYNGSWIDSTAQIQGVMVQDGNDLVYYFPQPNAAFSIDQSVFSWHFRFTYANAGTFSADADVVDSTDTPLLGAASLANATIDTAVIGSSMTLGGQTVGAVADASTPLYTYTQATTHLEAGQAAGENVLANILVTRAGGAVAGDVDLDYFALSQEQASCVATTTPATGFWCPLLLVDNGNGTLGGSFGPPATGFPLSDGATSYFRSLYHRGGPFQVSVSLDGVDTGTRYASATQSIDVAQLVLSASGPAAASTGATVDTSSTLTNPGSAAISSASPAPDNENVIGAFTIASDAGALGASDLSVSYLGPDSAYHVIPLTVNGDGSVSGAFGPPGTGFPVAAGYDATSLFRTVFAKAGNYTITTRVVGVTTASVFASVQQGIAVASSAATITIDPASLSQTYNGGSHPVLVTTTPAGLSYSVTYDGSSTAPTHAGSYAVVATITQPGYSGSANGTLVVAKAAATVALGNLTAVYDGNAHAASATTTPAGLTVVLSYDGGATPPTHAGSYAVVATINDADYAGSASGTLVISPASATVTLSNLVQVFDGTPKPVTVMTSPNVATSVTYDGGTTVPSAIGSYSVTAVVTDPDYAGSASATLTIKAAQVTVTLSNLARTYDGSPKSATVTTSPSGIITSVTYDGSSVAPTNAGSYSVVAVVTQPGYNGSATGTLVIAKAAATVTLSNLSQTYNGLPRPVNATTSPANLSTSITYDGSTTAPSAIGTYAVIATVTDSNYTGSASGTLTIGAEDVTVTLSNLAQTYDGTAKTATVTTSPSGITTSVTYDGSSTAPTNAGSYNVVATVTQTGYTGSASGTLVIAKASATVTLSNLTQTYDGTQKSATVTTTPAGLATSVTYDGNASAPSAQGSYTVVATVTDPNYTGSASGTLTIGADNVTVTLSNLAQTYDGTPKSATVSTSPSGITTDVTYNGSSVVPTNAGSYSVVAVVAQSGYSGSATGVLVIAKAAATVTLSNLTQTYDGAAKSATVTTTPAGLATSVTYDGNAAAPSALGSYTVVASVTDPNYTGSASGTLHIVAENAPNLSIAISDGRDFVQYGKLLTYRISVSNIGNVDATGATVSVPLPNTVLGANPGWTCIALGTATCGAGGNGALNDTANIPAGGGVVYLLNAWAKDDNSLNTDEIQVQASVTFAGDIDTSDNTATDHTMMVLFRDGFEAGGDGAQPIPTVDNVVALGSIDSSNTQFLDLSGAWSSAGNIVQIARLDAGPQDTLSVQAVLIDGQLLVRLVGVADARPFVGPWSTVPADVKMLALGLAKGFGSTTLMVTGASQDLTVRLSDAAASMVVFGARP